MALLRVKDDYVMFHCPACKHAHVVPFQNHPMAWSWNGSIDKPTLVPSLRVFCPADKELNLPEQTICHLNVTDGMLQYHGDNPPSHPFKAQTIPMVDWSE